MKIFSYWEGGVSWLERLSLQTMLASGHQVTIYSYDPHPICRAPCLVLSSPADDEEYIFGWLEDGQRISISVLYAPSDSELLRRYSAAITSLPVQAPWATAHVRFRRELEILFGRAMPSNLAKMSIGPRALTYFVHQLGLESRVSPRSRFYPIRESAAGLLVDSDDRAVRCQIGPATQVVHAWHGKLSLLGALQRPPSTSSYLGQLCRLYGI